MKVNTVCKYSGFITVVSLFILSGSGCATIVKNKGRQIVFESDPPGATVRIKGAVIGKTPCTVTMKGAPIAEFQLEGYQTRFINPVFEDMWRIEPFFWGNLAFLPVFIIGTPVGCLVDVATEHYVVIKSPVRTSLYPIGNSALPSSANFGRPSPTAYAPQIVPVPSSVGSPPAGNGASDRLKSLKELKDQGVLSESEYEAKKAELLKEF